MITNNSRKIMRSYIRRSNLPLNKYNELAHHRTECTTDEVSDRTAYDTGIDPQKYEL